MNEVHFGKGVTPFRFDDIECLKCGYVGLTSTGHCRKCYQDHKIEVCQ